MIDDIALRERRDENVRIVRNTVDTERRLTIEVEWLAVKESETEDLVYKAALKRSIEHIRGGIGRGRAVRRQAKRELALIAEQRRQDGLRRAMRASTAMRRLPRINRHGRSQRRVGAATKPAAKAAADPDGPSEPPGRRALHLGSVL